jgi:hypothetical protein
LIDFVKRLKPKQIFPIVKTTEAQGMMRERHDYLEQRVDLSILDTFLSKEPLPSFERPEFAHPPLISASGIPR